MQKRLILLALSLLCSHYSRCQTGGAPLKDTLIRNVIEQVVLFPQEKAYLHLDKPVYISGETIWFRAYLVDAVLHKPDTSQYVIVELISPSNYVISRVKIRQSQGAYSGHITLDENLPGGDYTICAYTEIMQNRSEEFFFKKPVRICSPLAATVNTEARFSYDDRGDNMTAEVSFEDIRTRKKISPDGLKISINSQPVRIDGMTDDTLARFSFRLPGERTNSILLIETKKGSKQIVIPYPELDYDVSFYPEGGYLLDGVSCNVAFKAVNSEGLPEKVTGKIIDENGDEYSQVETTHDGMGIFSLKAETGRSYYAICTNEQGDEKRFMLPAARQNMYSLRAEVADDTLYVSVSQSLDIQEQTPLFLLLHTRGIVHYASPWDPGYSSVSFDTRKFPSGVMQIILFDGAMNPLSERLIFCLNNDQAQLVFSTDSQNYEARQQVSATVKINSMTGFPQPGTFSVSVTDDNDIDPDSSVSIMTSLLLTSELRGYINNPGYYFRKNSPEASQALDLLMLINGWRRYNIPEVFRGKYETPLIPFKYGMEVKGRTRSLILGRPVEEGLIAAFSWEAGYFDETKTDSDGHFVFDRIEFQDSTTFVIQALSKKGSDDVELLIDQETFPGVSLPPLPASGKTDYTVKEDQLSSYITKADTKYTIENGMRTVYIEEVVIKGKAPEKNDYSYSYYMPKASLDIMTSEEIEEYQPVYVSDILRHFPNVDVVRDENGASRAIVRRLSYRMPTGGPAFNYAALVIDDIIIHDYDIDNIIDPSSIERIAVLTGSQATLLGGEGAGGAIVITTKKGLTGRKDIPRFNIKSVTPLGYQRPAEFYSPRYETEEQRDNRQPDLRTTIYWNPDVTVSSEGEASFDFYTADANTTYSVVIEGITSDGAIICDKMKISRR
jgi:hypothetical protein